MAEMRPQQSALAMRGGRQVGGGPQRLRRGVVQGTARRLRGLALPVALAVLWQLAATRGWADRNVLVPPAEVWAAFRQHLDQGLLGHALVASLRRDLLGFALGAGLGLLLGAATGLSRRADALLGGSFGALRQIAIFAWVPMLTAWFGIGELAKVVFIALAAFFPVFVNTQQGFRDVPPALREVARVHGLSPWRRLTRLLLPAAAPAIFTGLHLGLVYAWLGTIGAEYFMASGPGVGSGMVQAREMFAMDVVLFSIVIIGLVGHSLNLVGRRIEARALAWRPPVTSS